MQRSPTSLPAARRYHESYRTQNVEPTVRLDLDNESQPDAVLFIESAAGGEAQISSDGYIEGSTELIVEIAAGSVSVPTVSGASDTGSKKQAYRRNGVLEYVIWQSFENQLDWFCLQDGDYVLLQPEADRTLRSRIFSGLWLAVDVLLNNHNVAGVDRVAAGVAVGRATGVCRSPAESIASVNCRLTESIAAR